ncbi:MAG TPA: hypothetical protein VK513_09145 [Terriglobales bacterium]|nr:hypothetical protein [Terriglobales bacterium]
MASRQNRIAVHRSEGCPLENPPIKRHPSAKQALDGSTDALHGTFANDSVSISDATGFADSVWYSQSTLTIYIYPVIGKKVCPANSPNCADKDKVQETVQFAGPDTISAPTADGLQVEWYQPPWMPGNILSYPGNLQQLQAASFTDPNSFQSLTDPREWFTDTSDATAQATWTVGSKDGSTSSFNQNYSFETDLSFTLKAGFDDIVSASAGVSLDLSGSYGLSNLTNSTTSLSKSTGIGFTKKATFANPGEYGYWVTPYIFGQKQPGGVVDNKPLSTDVQTFGILQTGHVVDPLASGAGAFWTSWYTKGIDIGLNQPWRWSVMATATNPGDGSCLIFDNASSDVDCATPGIKTPGNPATDEFHWMRGLFITKASASGNSAGPQIGNATAGDQLLLRARVYNFSFQPMPANSSVHVRFYGTPWNRQENSAAGPSFLVGEQIASSSIPPFNTDTPYPNWVLVGQPFDTTPHANEDLVFWVVVWAQDEGGKLIADLPHHGLTSIPAATTDYSQVAAIEENYGNNLGFYKQVFHVSAYQSSVTQSNAPGGIEVPAEIISAGSERNQIRQGEPILISAKLRVGSAEVAHGIHVDFYDGEPRGTRKLIGSDRLPYLRASMIYKTGVIFRSGEAGVHRIFIVAGKGTTLEQEVELRPIAVTRAE